MAQRASRRLRDGLRPHRPDLGERPVPDLRRPSRALPGRAHRPLRRRVAADDARRRGRDRERPRALHEPRGPRDRGAARPRRAARADRRRPADHVGPALPPARPTAPAPGVLAEGHRPARGLHARRCARRCSTSSATPTTIDGAVDYAQHIPVGVIARMLGFPPEDGDLFRGFVHTIIEGVDVPSEERIARLRPDPGVLHRPGRGPSRERRATT